MLEPIRRSLGREERDLAKAHPGLGHRLAREGVMQPVVASQPVDRPACSAESRPAADPAPQPEARPFQGLQDRQAFGNLETLAQDKDLRHGKLHCRSAFLPITDHRSLAASGRRSVISDRWQVSYARAVSNTKISSEAARGGG